MHGLVLASTLRDEAHVTTPAVSAGTLSPVVVEADFGSGRWGRGGDLGARRGRPGLLDWPSGIKMTLSGLRRGTGRSKPGVWPSLGQ